MDRVTNMTSGNPVKLILFFAFPLILANLGQQFYMIADAIIVGQGIGVDALAAVGATDWSNWLSLWIIMALTQGFAIPVSHYFGRGDTEKLRQSVAAAIKLCLFTGIILTAVFMFAAKPLLTLLQTPENIFGGASEYLLTMYGGIIIVVAYNMSASILRALGDGKTPLIAIAVAAATNIGLDLLFVLIFKWGIFGAAIATVTAQFTAFLYCLFTLKKPEMMKLRKGDWIFRKEMIKDELRLGIPLALQNVFIAVGGMILQSAINKQGFIFIAGLTATNKIYGLLESSAISLGYSASTFVAQNYGAGSYSRIRKGIKNAFAIAVTLALAITVIVIIAGNPLISLFIDKSSPAAPETLSIASHYLFIMSLFLIPLYILDIIKNILQGLGNAIAPFISGVMEFLARVTVAYILSPVFGKEMLFIAEPSAWICAVTAMIILFIRRLRTLPLHDSVRQTDA